MNTNISRAAFGVLSSVVTAATWAGEPAKRPLVVCTTTMITDMATQLGGDRVQVVGIMKPKTDPHTYEPTPDDAMLLRKANLILYNGLHLEGKMVQMIESAGSKAVALSDDPRVILRGYAGGGTGAPDPHCWWDVYNFIVYTEKARDALITMDSEGVDGYITRSDAYVAALKKLNRQVKKAIDLIPHAQRYLVTSHDAFYYYGEAYGLTVDAVLGISTDAEVRALRANELASLVARHKIPAIFHETSVSAALNQMVDRVVELAAKEGHQVKVPAQALFSDSLDAPGTPAGTYIGALQENTRVIVAALSGKDVSDLFKDSEGGP